MSTNVTGTDYVSQMYASSTDQAKSSSKTSKTSNYGKTVGEPTLSEDAAKYYEQLKKKYNNMDFVLVSADRKEQANASAASFANASKTVVLIDEDKIEKMAADENYRNQYEGIISNAASGLSQLKSKLESTGANVQGYGMTVNDGGTASFFAVLKKSSGDQKARIEKKAEEKKANQKAADKKAEKEEQAERLKSHKTDNSDKVSADDDDTITITAGSIEELMKKIRDYTLEDQSNLIQTPEEKTRGQQVDYSI